MKSKHRTRNRVAFAVALAFVVAALGLAVQFYQVYSAPPVRMPINAEYDQIPVNIVGSYWLPGDFHGKYFTIDNGVRRTIGQPARYDCTLWIFGNSSTFDWNVADADTMTSQLQALFNSHDYRIRVVNMAVVSYRASTELARLKDTAIRPGDTVVFLDGVGDARDIGTEKLEVAAHRYRQFIDQAQSLSIARRTTFRHFLQPYIDDSLLPFYALVNGQRITIPASDFVDAVHLNAHGDFVVARALFDALTLI